MADDTDADVFVYTGIAEGAIVPRDVVHVRIDPSVLVIPKGDPNQDNNFGQKHKLETIKFHDEVREICNWAFYECTSLKEVKLSDGILSIGVQAFSGCTFTKFRSPPLVTEINGLDNCQSLFSLELPENNILVGGASLYHCYSLRNVAFTPNTEVRPNAFSECWDLLRIFDTSEAIANALKIRFEGLPIHSKFYFQSYYNQITTDEILNSLVTGENGDVDPTGFERDCLGMTPLHILACSTVQCLEVYQLMVEMYPDNLIVEDAWGVIPLLYAVWGDAPIEIVTFLVNSYQSLFPNHKFDWNDMVITCGCRSGSVVQNLLDIQKTLSPDYNIDWDHILDELTETDFPVDCKTFCFLVRCSIATRVNAIGVKHFRNAMANDDWVGKDNYFRRHIWHNETYTKLEYYELEYQKLKEMTTLLELAMWKIKMDDSNDDGVAMGDCNKKMKMDRSDFRLNCRISCGADHVVENLLPYLLPPDFVRSTLNEEDRDDISRLILDRFPPGDPEIERLI
jgi:hypothetical protein